MNRGRGGRFGGRDSRIVCQLCGRTGHIAIKCFKQFDIHLTGITNPSPQTYSSPQAYYTDMSQQEAMQEDYYAQVTNSDVLTVVPQLVSLMTWLTCRIVLSIMDMNMSWLEMKVSHKCFW